MPAVTSMPPGPNSLLTRFGAVPMRDIDELEPRVRQYRPVQAVWDPAFATADDCLLSSDQCVIRAQHCREAHIYGGLDAWGLDGH